MPEPKAGIDEHVRSVNWMAREAVGPGRHELPRLGFHAERPPQLPQGPEGQQGAKQPHHPARRRQHRAGGAREPFGAIGAGHFQKSHRQEGVGVGDDPGEPTGGSPPGRAAQEKAACDEELGRERGDDSQPEFWGPAPQADGDCGERNEAEPVAPVVRAGETRAGRAPDGALRAWVQIGCRGGDSEAGAGFGPSTGLWDRPGIGG